MRRQVRQLRRGEVADFKRCPKMWYWRWRKGYVPKAKQFGALELGSWVHLALADWYKQRYRARANLADIFSVHANNAILVASDDGAPDYLIEQAEELFALGQEMMTAYQKFYGGDASIDVIEAEIPLEFSISQPDPWDKRAPDSIIAIHKLKPDLVFRDRKGYVWLMEHKTAKSIRTEHLAIDNQARPYGVMAEPALRKLGLIRRSEQFAGILYNFLRKGLPDMRPVDDKGRSLNQNGTVSKKQPAPMFVRKPIRMTNKAKLITLGRIQQDAIILSGLTELVHKKEIDPLRISKTPHYSCPRMCPFFAMCVAEEEGTDIRLMERALYIRRDPYLYEEESTEERPGFEMG